MLTLSFYFVSILLFLNITIYCPVFSWRADVFKHSG